MKPNAKLKKNAKRKIKQVLMKINEEKMELTFKDKISKVRT